MTYGRVGWGHDFPAAGSLVTARAQYLIANPDAVLPPLHTGVGNVYMMADSSVKYAFYETGWVPGDLVAFDLVDGPAAQYASNLRKAMAVPAIARKRVEG
jgi:hypothetical protein